MKKIANLNQKEIFNKGITLIALVITIIVLLILAGISMASLTGENGLLNKATVSREKTLEAQLKEEIQLAIIEIQAEELSEEKPVTLETLANGQLVNKLQNITAELENNDITGEYKGYNYIIDDKLNVTIINKNTTIKTPSTSRYLLIEVNGYLENEDGAVLNEVSIYNKNYEKINYTVLKDLEYDSATDGKSSNWENICWDYTNLNDNAYTYVSNYPTGYGNCTLFLAGTMNEDAWARFIIDLGEETDIGQIRIAIGGYDELSPCGSRTPKEVSVYGIYDFIDGLEKTSTYSQNVIKRNNDGLYLIGKKTFSEKLLVAEWIEFIKDNSKDFVKARYLIFEVNGFLDNEDGAVLNEVMIYNKYDENLNYTVLKDLEYDTATNGKSYYWEIMAYWNYTNLNDNAYTYSSNAPTGNQNCTLFLNNPNGNKDEWARFVVDLGKETDIGQVKIIIGGYDELSPCKCRIPKEVSVYGVNNFIDGLEEASTYSQNIAKRNNDNLTFIGKKTFDTILLTPTEFNMINKIK